MTTLGSPIRLLDLVWANANAATGHSWERLNHAMRAALGLAVGAGFTFAMKDIDWIFEHYRSGRWIGDPEWVYALAILVGNKSAVLSFEHARERQPFIADDVDVGSRWGPSTDYAHAVGRRKRERLAVGFRFQWQGEVVTVTSFNSTSSNVTACSYHERDDRNKVKRRFTVTRADIIADRKARKARVSMAGTVERPTEGGER